MQSVSFLIFELDSIQQKGKKKCLSLRRYEQSILPQTTSRQQLHHLFVDLHILAFHQPMSNHLVNVMFYKNNFSLDLYLSTSLGQNYEQGMTSTNSVCLFEF